MEEDHPEFSQCHNCMESLEGLKYILKDEKPHCLKCYDNIFGNPCERCDEKISVDSKDLSFNGRHWHDKCFYCEKCQVTLVDQAFATKEKCIYCQNCYDDNFGPRCDGCDQIFKSGVKKYEYGGKQWHNECFVCNECKEPIGGKSFVPKADKIHCMKCHDQLYAEKCSKCSGVIRKGGITYKGEPWHKECFLCTTCEKELANTKFTSKDDKPYCAECFAELFSKRCRECDKPITGFGGCKFISIEEEHWHTECFNCSECKMNLVGKGFVTHNQAIVCSACGQKSVEAE